MTTENESAIVAVDPKADVKGENARKAERLRLLDAYAESLACSDPDVYGLSGPEMGSCDAVAADLGIERTQVYRLLAELKFEPIPAAHVDAGYATGLVNIGAQARRFRELFGWSIWLDGKPNLYDSVVGRLVAKGRIAKATGSGIKWHDGTKKQRKGRRQAQDKYGSDALQGRIVERLHAVGTQQTFSE